MKALLVDDQRIIGEAIKRLLEPEKDIVFFHCLDPALAMDTARSVGPDVILQDLVMPGVDGMDLVKAFKESPDFKGVPVIVLSSEEDADTKSRAFNLHADDYMVKIPHRAELVAKLRHHAEASAAKRTLVELRPEMDKAAAALEAAAWLDAVCFAASSVVKDLESPVQYIVNNMIFVSDAFRSLTRFRARLARLPIPPELAAAMKEAADQEELDFVFDDAPKAFRQSQAEMERANSMIGALRGVPLEPGASELSVFDLSALLKESLPLLKERLSAVAELKLDAPEALPKLKARKEELRLAVLTVAVGAARALEERRGLNAKKGVFEASCSFDGVLLKLRFKDDGSPVDAALAAKLLEPLVPASTARRGLRAVKRVVESAGGSFSLKGSAEGCEIELALPPAV